MLLKLDNIDQTSLISEAKLDCEVNGLEVNACISLTFPGSGSTSIISIEKLPIPLVGVLLEYSYELKMEFTQIQPVQKFFSLPQIQLPEHDITCRIYLKKTLNEDINELLLFQIAKPRALPLAVHLKLTNAILISSNIFGDCFPLQKLFSHSNFTNKSSVSFRFGKGNLIEVQKENIFPKYLEEDNDCVVCLENTRSAALIHIDEKISHNVVCLNCAEKLSFCPVCRRPIDIVVQQC